MCCPCRIPCRSRLIPVLPRTIGCRLCLEGRLCTGKGRLCLTPCLFCRIPCRFCRIPCLPRLIKCRLCHLECFLCRIPCLLRINECRPCIIPSCLLKTAYQTLNPACCILNSLIPKRVLYLFNIIAILISMPIPNVLKTIPIIPIPIQIRLQGRLNRLFRRLKPVCHSTDKITVRPTVQRVIARVAIKRISPGQPFQPVIPRQAAQPVVAVVAPHLIIFRTAGYYAGNPKIQVILLSFHADFDGYIIKSHGVILSLRAQGRWHPTVAANCR